MQKHLSNGEVADLESPFLQLTNFEHATSSQEAFQPMATPVQSPFQSVYERAGIEQEYDPDHEAIIDLMNELHDEDFDEFLQELAIEGQNVVQNEMPSHLMQNETAVVDKLDQHFDPLLDELDRMINHTLTAIDQRGETPVSSDELESLIDHYVPVHPSSPVVEHFWKKLKKKFKKVVKKGISYAKKGVKYAKKGIKYLANLALKHIMKIFKRLFPMLIKLAYKMGLFKKIPKKYRPVANVILKKIGVDPKKAYASKELPVEQQLFDSYIARILTASSAEEYELIDNDYADLFQDEVMLDYDGVASSRIRFIDELKTMHDDAPTAPPVEEFVSAIILASKLLGGRKKAVSFIGKHLGNFFSKWIGSNKKDTIKFAKHLIDKGLSKFGFEVAPESQLDPAFEAMAGVIEQTTREVAALPEDSFENETVLANHVVHAFESAASAYLPDILSEEQFFKRPDLKEARIKKLAWKFRKRKRRKGFYKYKKLNREIDIEVTPYIANEVKVFGGDSLNDVLQNQLGIEINGTLPATLHLFESEPGGNLQEIIANEVVFNQYAGLHPSLVAKQIFPLTSVAAGLLLGEPALGCKCKTKCLNGNTGRKGRHRFYYLEVPGAYPQTITAKNGIAYLRNTTHLKVNLNFIRNEIRLSLYLSEGDAQHIASEIRQYRKENASILIQKMLHAGLKTSFSRHTTQKISIVHPNVLPGKSSGEALHLIPRTIQKDLRDNLAAWTGKPLSQHLLNNSAQFVTAVDDSLDGVTVDISMSAPEGFNTLKNLIGFQKVQLSPNLFADRPVDMTIIVQPGNASDE